MEVIYPRCAGLDVHKETVVACVRIAGNGAPLQEVRTFATTTSRFVTPGHLLSRACLCPRNDESAGKRRSTRLRRGGNWLKTTLVQAAWRVRSHHIGALRKLLPFLLSVT